MSGKWFMCQVIFTRGRYEYNPASYRGGNNSDTINNPMHINMEKALWIKQLR